LSISENLTACALLKEIYYIEDCCGEEARLDYLKTKDGREIDFFVTRNEKPRSVVEVKWSDTAPSRHFSLFEKHFPEVYGFWEDGGWSDSVSTI